MSLSLSLLACKMGIILNWLLRELNEMIHANLLALSLVHSVEVVLGPWVPPPPSLHQHLPEILKIYT